VEDFGFASSGESPQQYDAQGLGKAGEHMAAVGFVASIKRMAADADCLKEPGHGCAAHASAPAIYQQFGAFEAEDVIGEAAHVGSDDFQSSLYCRCPSSLFVQRSDFCPLVVVKQGQVLRSGNMSLRKFGGRADVYDRRLFGLLKESIYGDWLAHKNGLQI
jgi:hypothetical protein